MGNQIISWPSIRDFFSKLFRALMSSPPDLPFPIRGVFTPVKIRCGNWSMAGLWGCSPNATRNNAAQAALCFVEQVEHFKNGDSEGHEYLRFRVSHPAGDRKAWIFAHRIVISRASDPSSSSSSDISAPALRADNKVVWATDRSRAYPFKSEFPGSCVRTMIFSDQERFSVLQLSTLLQVTSETYHRDIALLPDAPDYWFPRVVWAVLGRLFPAVAESIKVAKAADPATYLDFEVQQHDRITAVHEDYLQAREEIKRKEREYEEERQAEIQRIREAAERKVELAIEEVNRQTRLETENIHGETRLEIGKIDKMVQCNIEEAREEARSTSPNAAKTINSKVANAAKPGTWRGWKIQRRDNRIAAVYEAFLRRIEEREHDQEWEAEMQRVVREVVQRKLGAFQRETEAVPVEGEAQPQVEEINRLTRKIFEEIRREIKDTRPLN